MPPLLLLQIVLFQDGFLQQGNKLDLSKWTTEVGASSYLGRTQLADWVTPNGTGQFVVGGEGAYLDLQTFNPTGLSFYGNHAKTLAAFQPGANDTIVLRARVRLTSLQKGLVYGIYFYSCVLNACASKHDEIDIELLTNHLQPGSPMKVQLNRYVDEPHNAGHGGLVTLPMGFDPLAWHNWEIRWSQSRIEYLVDGAILGVETTFVPQRPMHASMIAWAPDFQWAAAYDASLQPDSNFAANQHHRAAVRSLSVERHPSGSFDNAIPFGVVDVPVDQTNGVTGGLAVGGWALDDSGIAKVSIWRDPVANEPVHPNGLVYISDAFFVEGARPDVAATYPTVPSSSRAGWGMLVLTNMLPNSGNGTYRLHAIATDYSGKTALLGSKRITCTNSSATKPFGTIDTPSPGGTVSGAFNANFGWALTPQPHHIPMNGSTIVVFIDGVPYGSPIYNLFRPDVASLFPGYANTNGAVGRQLIDSRSFSNGLHSIAWSVTDSAGRVDGIGSRLFRVDNGPGASPSGAKDKRMSALRDGVRLRMGYDPAEPFEKIREQDGVYRVRASAKSRLEVQLPVDAASGCLVQNDECVRLPSGSAVEGNTFYWQIDAAFRGRFDLRFGQNVALAIDVE